MVLNAAQLHLTLNHFPVVLIVTSLSFLIWGSVKSSESSLRTGLTLVILAAIFSVPTFLSGDPSADILEKSGLSKTLIHDHEEAAEAGFISLIVDGLIAIGCWILWRRKHPKTRILLLICLVVSVLSTALLARAAHLGGIIRHEEIRSTQ